jgi:hypothetical protein
MHKRGKTPHHILTLITECVILTGRTVCMVNETSYSEDVWGVEKDIHAFLTSAIEGGNWENGNPVPSRQDNGRGRQPVQTQPVEGKIS